MARNLEQLTKQYGKAAPGKGGMMPGRRGPGGPGGPRGPRLTGKPKNTAKTIGRMLGYVSQYKLRLIGVALLMLTSTISSLIGSYMLAPVIDKITSIVAPHITLKISPIQKIADSVISRTSVYTKLLAGDNIYAYIIAALIILAVVYICGVAAQ